MTKGSVIIAAPPPAVSRLVLVVSMLMLAACGGGDDGHAPPLDPAARDPEVKVEGPVVFVGDSITGDWNVSGIVQPYPTLTELVPDSVDVAYPGATSIVIETHFPTTVLALHPSVVVIEAGTNDVVQLPPDGIVPDTDAIARMAEKAAAQGARVLIASIPSTAMPQYNVKAADIAAFNYQLLLLCVAHGYQYVNYQAVLQVPTGAENVADFAPDGVHPNAAGFRAMWSVLYVAINL